MLIRSRWVKRAWPWTFLQTPRIVLVDEAWRRPEWETGVTHVGDPHREIERACQRPGIITPEARGRARRFTGRRGLRVAALAWRLVAPAQTPRGPQARPCTWASPSSRPEAPAAPCNLDLTEPLDETAVAELRAAWLSHHVLVFPNQPIDDDDLERFALAFGPFGSRGRAVHLYPAGPPRRGRDLAGRRRELPFGLEFRPLCLLGLGEDAPDRPRRWGCVSSSRTSTW